MVAFKSALARTRFPFAGVGACPLIMGHSASGEITAKIAPSNPWKIFGRKKAPVGLEDIEFLTWLTLNEKVVLKGTTPFANLRVTINKPSIGEKHLPTKSPKQIGFFGSIISLGNLIKIESLLKSSASALTVNV